MAAKVKPLHDRIIVKRLDEEEKTAGGIIIPDAAKEKPQEGMVVAVGSGRREDARWWRSTSKRGTRSCSESIPARRSSWAATSISS